MAGQPVEQPPVKDAFISHAWEDKEGVARPLAERLRAAGFSVWYDEYALRVGDSLWNSINEGLASCRFGIVILSPYFLRKEWPQRELQGLQVRASGNVRRVLPVLHRLTIEELADKYPVLADTVALRTDSGLDAVVNSLMQRLREARLPDLQELLAALVDYDRRLRALIIEITIKLTDDPPVGWHGHAIPPPSIAPLDHYLVDVMKEDIALQRVRLESVDVDQELQPAMDRLRTLVHLLAHVTEAIHKGWWRCYNRSEGELIGMPASGLMLNPILEEIQPNTTQWEQLREKARHDFRTLAHRIGVSESVVTDVARWPVWCWEAMDSWFTEREGVWGAQGRPPELSSCMED